MSDHKLVIYPTDPAAALPSVESLREGLTGIGFLGPPITIFGDTHYEQGPRFAALVPFADSHTAIILGQASPEPNAHLVEQAHVDSRNLCTVEFDGPTSEIEFLGAANIEDPACTECGHQIEEWGDLVSAWYGARDTYSWSCPECNASLLPWQLDWSHTNGFGRLAIAIWHVHHGEAAPTAELLESLQRWSNVSWDYFYYHL